MGICPQNKLIPEHKAFLNDSSYSIFIQIVPLFIFMITHKIYLHKVTRSISRRCKSIKGRRYGFKLSGICSWVLWKLVQITLKLKLEFQAKDTLNKSY